jgi:hypothetical protein
MTKLPEATSTDSTFEDFKDVYGPPLIAFNIPQGICYEWHPKRGDVTPHLILNEYWDGTRTTAQIVPEL